MVFPALSPGSTWSSTKPLRVMKMTAVLIVACFLQVSASVSQTVTLKVRNASLKDVLAAVKKQTGYSIFFNAELLTDAKPVTLDMQNASLSDVLAATFSGQPLNFVIENKTVFISRSITPPSVDEVKNKLNLFLPDPVKIRVTDKDGQPLAGATVSVKNSKKAGVTDASGYITFDLNAGDIVEISFVGYATQKLKISEGKTSFSVVLETGANTNEEVVVMAYGQKRKKTEVIGSAVQINADRIEHMPAVRIDAMLEGQLPGVRVTLNSDDASSTKQRMNIRIRGQGSFNASNEPLWIIDGTPFYTGDRTNMIPGIQTSITPLSYINPADIESITVLKDAAAAAIYGANASNGVILITTKSGGRGKPVFNLTLNNGFSKINKNTTFKTLDAAQYLELAKESYLNAGKDLASFPYTDNDMNNYSGTNTNWTDEFYRTGVVNDANLSFRGGMNKFSYALSGGYYNNKSTIIGNTQNRTSFSANLKYYITPKLNINLISRYSFNKNNTFNPSMDYLEFLPIFSPYNNDGSYRLYNKKISGLNSSGDPEYTTVKFFNTVAERDLNDDIQKSNAFNNNAVLDYEIVKGLKTTTQFGMDYMEVKQNIYKSRDTWSGRNTLGEAVGYAQRSYNKTITKTFIERLTYSKYFGLHGFQVLAGLELFNRKYNTDNISGSGFKDDSHRTVDFADVLISPYSSVRQEKGASYFGQIEYNYDKRYYMQVTGRRDGNSTFGSQSRWANFGAVGAGWDIKNDMLSEIPQINNLRIDASYGSTGNSRLSNQDPFGVYSTKPEYNYGGITGSVMSGIANKRLRWETARQLNLKLNLEVFNRLRFLVEAYRKTTIEAIVSVPVSRATGETSAQSNTGELRNEGIEATITWDIIKNDQKEMYWWVEVNGARNRNKALKLYNENDRTFGNYIWREGYDVNTLYLIRWAGVDPRDGAPLWLDAAGNLTRVYSIDNRVPWKTASPDLFGGIRTQFAYKNFSASVLFTYTIGGYQFSTFSRGINSDGLNIEADNQSINQMDRWQQPGDISLNPKPIWGVTTRSTMNSTRFVFRQTHIRLGNIAVGYKLSDATAKKLGVKGCRVSLVGNELFFLTPYEKSNRNSFKQSRSGYPLEKSFLLTFNVSF